MLLPAVVRDLFRKSGRPLEKELDLVPVEPMREHRFEDGTRLDLPSGSRSAQIEAIDAALGDGLGRVWVGVHGGVRRDLGRAAQGLAGAAVVGRSTPAGGPATCSAAG